MTDPQSTAARHLAQVEESTRHLLHTVAELAPESLAEPSALPGWTRGHVLAHLARNADSLVNLLEGARTGTDIPQYASDEAREQGIERDAPRPLEVQLADLRDSHARFVAAAAQLGPESWAATVRHRFGYTFPAFDIPAKRVVELEFHHVDLAAGYTPAHWPQEFAVARFRAIAAGLAGEASLPAVELVSEDTADRAVIGAPAAAGAGPALTVEGPVRALTAWLSGRSTGDGLRHAPGTALPQLPPMG
ncbi:maleylpyruvate isomerase family mycothiol-dependent enzyme [Kitasatospora sp. NPDC018619]|uniref:maleylpyruvate isomerase family mycothiol-dependent enzyme n=1 Tax=unclassified Kitasatospora TaxID=2633591 RepID=UPI0037932867